MDELADKRKEIDLFNAAVAAINNTARVADIAGDQLGVVSATPFYVVVNPDEVARAVIRALRAVDSTKPA